MKSRHLLAAATGGWVAGWSAYALVLLGAAWRHRPAPPAPADLELIVLVPAHDEERDLPVALASLAAAGARHPARVLVIADNCSDDTAAVARAGDAEVWERSDSEHRGKGHALRWAIERLRDSDAWARLDAIVIVDADCSVNPGALEGFAGHLGAGADVVQGDYVVANPESSPATALRAAAFRLTNTVRAQGKERLGLSVGLGGTGMALRREVLERVPWSAASITEDAEYHVRLVEAGFRVAFAPDVEVRSPMPTSLKATRSQRTRWEAGFVELARRFSGRLMLSGIRKRDPVRVVTGLELMAPPQSLLALEHLLALGLAITARSRRLAGFVTLSLAGQMAFVVGGLAFIRAPRAVWLGLLHAPVLMASNVAVYARILTGRGPSEFVRTERDQDHPAG